MTQKVAALFPGQGSQEVGMARELYQASPAAKLVLDEAEAALPGLLQLMWEGPAEELRLTANQQPALVAAGVAAYSAYLEAEGAEPQLAAGHSLGEYTALVAAGSLSVGTAVQLVRKRGEYMQEAVPEGEGAMAAVLKLSEQDIREVLAALPVGPEEPGSALVAIANLNAPGQTVVSGTARGVARATEALKARGGRVIPLKVSAPFHSPLMLPAANRLAVDLAGVSFGEPLITVVSNVTAEPIAEAAAAGRLLVEQVTAPVRWVECVEKLRAMGATRFVEFGSGKVLTGLLERILPGALGMAVTDSESLAAAVAPVGEEAAG